MKDLESVSPSSERKDFCMGHKSFSMISEFDGAALTYNETKCVAPRGLGPDQAQVFIVDNFCCTIDVAATNPCCYGNSNNNNFT